MKTDDIKRMARDVLEQGAVECDFIEYKKSVQFKAGILKTVCAYANNYMNREIGLIFIGVEEVSNPQSGEKAVPKRPITGIKPSLIETTENEIKALLSHVHPRPQYHLIDDNLDDRAYILIAVEPGNNGPYETSTKAEKDKSIGLKAGRYIRVKRDSRFPNGREEFELLKKFADYHFSSDLNDRATIDDLNYEYMKEYLARIGARDDIRALSKLDMAKSLNLIGESEYGGYRAKNFAVLMFANRPADFIPEAYTQVIREAVGTDKMEAKVFDGPIWIQAERVASYFKDTIMAAYTIREADTIEHRIVYNWPLAMFEELATNCILHKEYGKRSPVEIFVYRDKIVFVNHNRPLPPTTIEDLNEKIDFNDRQYLNPEIKECFKALGLIETYGSGIRRAKKAMDENGSKPLIFEPANDSDDYTMATAYINEEFARIETEENRGSTTPKTTPKTKSKTSEQIMEMIRLRNGASIEDMANALNLTKDGIKYHIRKLKAEGKIERIGSNRSGHWEIKR